MFVFCLLQASKVWDDLSMINEDFTVVCPMFSLADINRLEINFLQILKYHLTVSGMMTTQETSFRQKTTVLSSSV